MGVMAWSLSTEERKQVRDAFLELDTSRSGTITLPEFKQALHSKFKLNDEALEKAFKALDANHTDEIHYSEFLAAMVSSRVALHDGLLKETFRRFDTDSSGSITVENLREVLGESFEGHEVEELIAEADMAKDGKISYEEFITYLRGGMGSVKDDHAHAAARVIDKVLKKQATKALETNKAESPKMQLVADTSTTPNPEQPSPSESSTRPVKLAVTENPALEFGMNPLPPGSTAVEDASARTGSECCHAACTIH